MTSLSAKDTTTDNQQEYEHMTVLALTALRQKLHLQPHQHSIVPAHLEPPVWQVEEQQGMCPRSKRTYTRQSTPANSSTKPLLPSHFRLFPSAFVNDEAPFTKDLNATLCRFLRARDYDVDKACEMYNNAVEIRALHHASTLLQVRDPNEMVWQHGTPHYHYGHDKLGRPFYIEFSGRVRVGRLMEPKGYMTFADFTKRHMTHMECMSRRIEHASKRHGAHVSQLSQIMDLEGLSYFDDSRGMQLFKDAINMDQNVYPEYLGNLFLINAPMIFRGMWVLIRSWMETKTAAKFHVLGSDYLPTLLQYIDQEELPVEYGGTNTLPLPVLNFDAVPSERPEMYTGVPGLNEDGSYEVQGKGTGEGEEVAEEGEGEEKEKEEEEMTF
jgi:hypothetical protein